MRKIIVLLILISVILIGCQTQCPDCNCSKLDCDSCEPHIEYQTKEVEKKVYVDKIIEKIQCVDGSVVDSISDCKNIIDLNPTPHDYNEDKCNIVSNKQLVEVFVGDLDINTEKFNRKNIDWYPSLNEGFVKEANLIAKNTGCTKIFPSFDAYLIKDNKIVSKIEDFDSSIMAPDGIYPGKDITISLIYFRDFHDLNKQLKFTEPGEYVLRVILNNNIEKTKQELAVREDKFIIK